MLTGAPAEVTAGTTRVVITPETARKTPYRGPEVALQSSVGATSR